MKYSHLGVRSLRDVKAYDSVNATLLTKAGYISQVAAGVYALLPLGLRTVEKIKSIIRDELNKVGAVELLMTSITPKSLWEASGRWQDKGMREIFYYLDENSSALAPTHEEQMVQVVKPYIQSYQDLPLAFYQIQTKFRKELRARSGLLRGREFIMKDLYSFHISREDMEKYYEKIAAAYGNIFKRMGLTTYRVKAKGGVFMEDYSDEFQVLCESGEDEILYDKESMIGYNVELEDEAKENKLSRGRSVEVGNIFKLGSKYSDAAGLMISSSEGKVERVYMASYGIGITRLLGLIAELFNDERGLKMPTAVAPYLVYAIDLTKDGKGGQIIADLEKSAVEVLFDDRKLTAGEKFVEADLVGIPYRLVVSQKTIESESVEIKNRLTGETKILPINKINRYFQTLD